MPTVAAVADFLESFAPARLAADWDNVGLLLGDRSADVERVMTCLTVTPETAGEAIDEQANLVVTHHPFPFHAMRRATTDDAAGRTLLALAAARIAVYSPHTAFDSALEGINQRLAEGLGLRDVEPLLPLAAEPALGTGRMGKLPHPLPLADIARRLASFLRLESVQVVGDSERPTSRVAAACGSAGELLEAAQRAGCDCFVTGEARFHTCLEAKAGGVSMLLAGHYASERFAVEALAEILARQFGGVSVWASRREADPIRTIKVQ
jgi:dinuclear metal center YbgI/SA1388 family protein